PSTPPLHTLSLHDALPISAPAVVNIYTTQMVSRDTSGEDDELLNRFMEAPRRERLLSSLGSGVIVSDKGYLLTSNHVVQDADEIDRKSTRLNSSHVKRSYA